MALSGGVDSSVSAKLLQENGETVVGVYFVFHENSLAGVKRAQAVAEKLGIALHVQDCRTEFQNEIISNFLQEYAQGRTPNPCALCNPLIKFQALCDLADKLKIAKIATGHYAQVRDGRLYRAVSRDKDQTYFLYRLSEKVLRRLVLPLGTVASKNWVQDYARQTNLETFFQTAEESQDFCFLGQMTLREMLEKNLPEKYFQPGAIISVDGKILGRHNGLPSYTLGQRKGIEIGGNGPWFVVDRDFAENQLIVGREEDCFGSKFALEKTIWRGQKPQPEEQIDVQIRFRAPAVSAHLSADICELQTPQKSITPGQSAVFYRADECLGGGFIADLLK